MCATLLVVSPLGMSSCSFENGSVLRLLTTTYKE